MRVLRMGLRPLNPLILTQSPEIPQEYHFDIVTGAAFRALAVMDTDASAPMASANYERLFNDAILQARRDVRKRYKLGPRFVVGETGAW